jgi:hypothetical protein
LAGLTSEGLGLPEIVREDSIIASKVYLVNRLDPELDMDFGSKSYFPHVPCRDLSSPRGPT